MKDKVLNDLRNLFREKKYKECRELLKLSAWIIGKEKTEEIKNALDEKEPPIIRYAKELGWKEWLG